MTSTRLSFACLALVLCACNGSTTTDAGEDDLGVVPDAGHDAGGADAGTTDAGGADAGTTDAGGADAGTTDAGTPDAATPDSGSADSAVADSAIPPDAGGPAGLCTSTGGTIGTASCCTSVDSFPNNCTTGACGCSPTYSHNVQSCTCPGSMCFDPAVGCH